MRNSFILFLILVTFRTAALAQFDSVIVYHNYSYSDVQGIDYGLYERVETHLDSAGRITLHLSERWNGFSFDASYRTSYTYDAFGNKQEELYQYFEGNAWTNLRRIIDYHSAFNRVDSSFDQEWLNGAWINNEVKYYFYNAGNHLVEKLEFGYRQLYFPDSNGHDTLVIQQYDSSGVWADDYRTRMTYHPNGRIKSSSILIRNSFQQWETQDSTSFVYYPNDSLFLSKKFQLSGATATLIQADSLTYSGDTTYHYSVYDWQITDPLVYPNRDISFGDLDSYNYYFTYSDYFNGTVWVVNDFSSSVYDSLTDHVNQEWQSGGSEGDETFIFDSDGHLITTSGSSTSSHGYYSYYDHYYYYYLTNGDNNLCPGEVDSLWIVPGMNSYSWNTGGNLSYKLVNTDGKTYCNLVNQYGHAFQSEPKYMQLGLSPTAPSGNDSSMLVCRGDYNFILEPMYLPVYNYEWLRNDSLVYSSETSELHFEPYTQVEKIDGPYRMVISNSCGSDTSSVTNINFSQATVQILPGISFTLCPDDTVTLQASTGFDSYLWNTGDTSAIAFCYSNHVNRQVIATDSLGCESGNYVNVFFTFQPWQLPLDILQVSDSILRSLSVTSGDFQWFLNGDSIQGATNYSLTIDQSGFYKFIYSADGCLYESLERYFNYSPFRVVFNQDSAWACVGQSVVLNSNFYHVVGGVPPFSYSWSPSTGLNNTSISSPTLTPSVPASYIFTITDSTGATARDTIYIDPRTPAAITLTASKPNVCSVISGNDYWDTLRVSNVGDGLVYFYRNGQIDNSPGNDSLRYVYQPGNYWVQYVNGCYSHSDTVTIGLFPDVPVPTVRLMSTPSDWCAIDSVTLIADLPDPDSYQYEWLTNDPENFSAPDNDTIAIHSGGVYLLRITDQNNCHNVVSFNTEAWSGDSIVSFDLNPDGIVPVCGGDTVTLYATEYPGWNYSWYNYQSDLNNHSSEYKTIYSGKYIATVSNGFGCHGSDSVYLSFGNTANKVTLNYNNFNLIASSVNYVSSWNWYLNDTLIAGATADQYHPLVPGWYKAEPSVLNACGYASDSMLISCTVASVISGVTCPSGCDGQATINPIGVAPYSIQWVSGDTTVSIDSLCRGNYIVNVTDHNGCLAADSVYISGPVLFKIQLQQHPPSCLMACDASVASVISGGSPPYGYLWTGGATTPGISGICAGIYQLIITDQHGCMDSASVDIQNPVTVVMNDSIINATCNLCSDGGIDLTIQGGIPPYHIIWSSGDTTTDISSKPKGVYTACVTDQSGCEVCDTFSIGFLTFVEEPDFRWMKIFPNPFDQSAVVEISIADFSKKYYAVLINSLGETMIRREINSRQFTIDGSEVMGGIYYLKIMDRSGRLILLEKVVIIH